MALTINDINIFATGVDHPECVCVHPDGSVWCGGEAGQIYRISPDGSELKEVNNTGGFVQGVAFSPDGSWLAVCDSGNHCVWKLNMATYELEMFADGADGERFNIPISASQPSAALWFNALMTASFISCALFSARIRSRTFKTPLSYKQVFKLPCGVMRMRLQVPQKVREYAAIMPISPLCPGIL
jgi:streptogramin lyase